MRDKTEIEKEIALRTGLGRLGVLDGKRLTGCQHPSRPPILMGRQRRRQERQRDAVSGHRNQAVFLVEQENRGVRVRQFTPSSREARVELIEPLEQSHGRAVFDQCCQSRGSELSLLSLHTVLDRPNKLVRDSTQELLFSRCEWLVPSDP